MYVTYEHILINFIPRSIQVTKQKLIYFINNLR